MSVGLRPASSIASDGVAGPLAAGVRLDGVVAVGCDGRPHQAGQDWGAARLGVLLGFDEQQRAAFAEHHAVAIFVEGAAGAGRVVVVGRQDAQLGERRHGHGLDPGFDAAANRDVGFAENNVLPRVGDGRCAGGVGSTGAMIPALAPRSNPTAAAGALGMCICTASGLAARMPRAFQSS